MVLAVYKKWMQGGWLPIRADARGLAAYEGGCQGLAAHEAVPGGWLPMRGCEWVGCLGRGARGLAAYAGGIPGVGCLYGGIPGVGCL